MAFLHLLLICTVTLGQQVYIPGQNGPVAPDCSPTTLTASFPSVTPSFYFSNFSYSLTQTTRFATPVVSFPASTYAAAYPQVSHFFSNLSTTSWGNWDPNATDTATDTGNSYGQASFSALWQSANLPNFTTRGIYSATVSPTPVASSELVYPPPPLYSPNVCLSFPKDFIFGGAASAPQIEGAVADEGKVPSFVDIFEPFLIAPNPEILELLNVPSISNDYVADENYYLYKQDIERLAAIGFQYYSFSIPWTRVLPFVYPGSPVNSQALSHYDDLINYVISKGMKPIVTLLHLDTPLQFYGLNFTVTASKRLYYGNLNGAYDAPDFLDAFVNYGKIVMAHYADRVPIWITINEPQASAASGLAVNNIIKSHAQLHHFYHNQLNGTGKVSMKMTNGPAIPLEPADPSHLAAAQHYNDLYLGAFLDPLVFGHDYPAAFKMTEQDYVPLNASDLAHLKGTLDFVAIDIYSAIAVSPPPPDVPNIPTCAANNATTNPLYPSCVLQTDLATTAWNLGAHPDYVMYNTAPYLRTQLSYLWNTWRLPVMLTEFGLPASAFLSQVRTDVAFDSDRSEYYLSNLNEILKSIWLDGVDVVGALAWSWIDNHEFFTFGHQFGLQGVNRTTQERFYKRSFFDVIDFVEGRRMKKKKK